ncbi:MAG: hypothetical protein JHC38_11000 [Thiotrichales bacterium]|jgi:hypothetical protein|nr:hypothetical protein [Thiotrichales bacterium]
MKIEIDNETAVHYAAKLVGIVFFIGVLIFTVPKITNKTVDVVSRMMQPQIAVINTNALLTEKGDSIKQRLIDAKTEDERAVIMHEMTVFGEQLNQWLDQRVPEICGKHCVVLDERMVIRGARMDLTQAFRDEQLDKKGKKNINEIIEESKLDWASRASREKGTN